MVKKHDRSVNFRPAKKTKNAHYLITQRKRHGLLGVHIVIVDGGADKCHVRFEGIGAVRYAVSCSPFMRLLHIRLGLGGFGGFHKPTALECDLTLVDKVNKMLASAILPRNHGPVCVCVGVCDSGRHNMQGNLPAILEEGELEIRLKAPLLESRVVGDVVVWRTGICFRVILDGGRKMARNNAPAHAVRLTTFTRWDSVFEAGISIIGDL